MGQRKKGNKFFRWMRMRYLLTLFSYNTKSSILILLIWFKYIVCDLINFINLSYSVYLYLYKENSRMCVLERKLYLNVSLYILMCMPCMLYKADIYTKLLFYLYVLYIKFFHSVKYVLQNTWFIYYLFHRTHKYLYFIINFCNGNCLRNEFKWFIM